MPEQLEENVGDDGEEPPDLDKKFISFDTKDKCFYCGQMFLMNLELGIQYVQEAVGY